MKKKDVLKAGVLSMLVAGVPCIGGSTLQKCPFIPLTRSLSRRQER